MGQKDLTQKSLEWYPDVFADIINALLYDGKPVVSEENLQSAPTETLYRDSQKRLRNQFHDVSKYVIKNDEIKMQYMLENETTVRRKTVLRKAGYQGAVYRQEYDGDMLYPVISILLYWGKKRWRSPKSLKGLLACDDDSKRYMDDCKLIVYEMAYLPYEIRQKLQSDMRIVTDYLTEGKDYVPTRQGIKHLDALLMLLQALTGDIRYEEILPLMREEQEKKGEVTMCELLDKYENRGLERGMAQGMAQGMERVNELIKCLIRAGRSTEIERAVSDKEYQNHLLCEYGL